MLISDLQNRLRKVIEQRIAAGVLTGTILAKETGFKQAHISNFIHGHRGLSVEGFDRLLRALSIRATDLIECSSPRKVESQDYDEIPLVAGATANQPNFGAADVEELVRFQRAFLRRIRPSMVGRRGNWRRFIALKTDGSNAAAMHPFLSPTSTLLIDRHYNALKPYSNREPNMYVFATQSAHVIRYVEPAEGNVILRPASASVPIQLLTAPGRRGVSEAIVGRVCHIGTEI
jgi:hypothetical protein